MKLIFLVLSLISISARSEDLDDFTSKADMAPVHKSSRAPSAKEFENELKKMKEASAAKDENGVIQAAVRILGTDAKNLQALNALAVHYFNQGKFGMSRIMLLRAMNDHPNIPALYNNLGVIYLSEGKQKQAIGSFRKAMEIDPNYAIASVNLGTIYLEFRDYKKAADTLGVGYEAMKSDLRRGNGRAVEIANNYAVALSGAGDLDRSKEVFQKILKSDESNGNTLYNYAVLLVARMRNKKEGEKVIARLKFLAEGSMQKKIEELEKMLSGT